MGHGGRARAAALPTICVSLGRSTLLQPSHATAPPEPWSARLFRSTLPCNPEREDAYPDKSKAPPSPEVAEFSSRIAPWRVMSQSTAAMAPPPPAEVDPLTTVPSPRKMPLPKQALVRFRPSPSFPAMYE